MAAEAEAKKAAEAKKTAISNAESDTKKAVLRQLKDPDSANFGRFTLIDDTHACLTVNARNSYGGYTGDQEAWLTKPDGEWHVYVIKAAEFVTCESIMTKMAANDLKRQGAGHTGKVLNIHKDGNFNFYEVESNGEKLLIYQVGQPVGCKVGDTIEIPDSLPSKNVRKESKDKYPETIWQPGKIKIVN